MTFSTLSFVGFIVVSLLVFALIVIKSHRNYREVSFSGKRIIIKGFAALLIWLVASAYIFISQAIYSIGLSHSVQPSDSISGDSGYRELIISQVIWVLLGIAIVYWVSRRPRLEVGKTDA